MDKWKAVAQRTKVIGGVTIRIYSTSDLMIVRDATARYHQSKKSGSRLEKRVEMLAQMIPW